jgi:hypothetical protein
MKENYKVKGPVAGGQTVRGGGSYDEGSYCMVEKYTTEGSVEVLIWLRPNNGMAKGEGSCGGGLFGSGLKGHMVKGSYSSGSYSEGSHS